MSLLGIQLDPRISLGNVITALSVAIGLVYAAGEHDAGDKQLRGDVATHGTRIERVEKRVSDLEVSSGRTLEAFDWIKKNMQELKEAINARR